MPANGRWDLIRRLKINVRMRAQRNTRPKAQKYKNEGTKQHTDKGREQ